MAQCSVPGCTSDAVLQWQRAASAPEADAHIEFLAASQQAVNDNRRSNLELQIADLQSTKARLTSEGRLTPGASKVLDDAIAAKQALLTREDVPPAVFTGGVTVVVYGCATHAVDGEQAAQLHASGCSSEGPCGCQLPAPVVEPDPPAGVLPLPPQPPTPAPVTPAPPPVLPPVHRP